MVMGHDDFKTKSQKNIISDNTHQLVLVNLFNK